MTRYTLEQMTKLTKQALRDGTMNEMVDGYPLLHSLLIELRDETDTRRRQQYKKLIERVVLDERTDIDVRDKHLSTPLMDAASEIGDLALVQFFIKHGADPNIAGGFEHWTALEKTVFASPKNIEILDYLKSITDITDTMQNYLKNLMQRAIEEKEVLWINAIMRLGIVPYGHMKSSHVLTDFREGCWIRTIADIPSELAILAKRASLSAKALQGYCSDDEVDDHYTKYSPATFVKDSVPIMLFSPNEPGVIIRTKERTIDYWNDGQNGERLTRAWGFHRKKPLGYGAKGEYCYITETKISELITEFYELGLKLSEEQERLDEYGVLANYYLQFAWNEGLLRYQSEDIIGFYVDPECKKSSIGTLQLRQKLGLKHVHLYHYSDRGDLRRISAKELQEKWGATSEDSYSRAVSIRKFSGRYGSTEASLSQKSDLSYQRPRGYKK